MLLQDSRIEFLLPFLFSSATPTSMASFMGQLIKAVEVLSLSLSFVLGGLVKTSTPSPPSFCHGAVQSVGY